MAPFWAADRLFILTPKSRKTRAKPESVQGPPRGRFWSHFGVHFGLILGAFWDHFGSVWDNFRKYTQNTCNYVQIRANYMQIRTDVRKILSNMRKCRRSYVKIAENCMNFWNRFGRKLQAVCWQCYHFVLKSSSSSRRVGRSHLLAACWQPFAGSHLLAVCWQLIYCFIVAFNSMFYYISDNVFQHPGRVPQNLPKVAFPIGFQPSLVHLL